MQEDVSVKNFQMRHVTEARRFAISSKRPSQNSRLATNL